MENLIKKQREIIAKIREISAKKSLPLPYICSTTIDQIEEDLNDTELQFKKEVLIMKGINEDLLGMKERLTGSREFYISADNSVSRVKLENGKIFYINNHEGYSVFDSVKSLFSHLRGGNEEREYFDTEEELEAFLEEQGKKKTPKQIEEFFNSLELDIRLMDYLCNDLEEIDQENVFDSIQEKLEENNAFDLEIIYYDSAIKYLAENDPSLQESLALASEMGFEPANLSSEILASLLASQNAREEFASFEDTINQFFGE